MSKAILIAGGTDGIGFDFLKSVLENKNFDIYYVIGRNFMKVDSLMSKCIVPICCDIQNMEELPSILKMKIRHPLSVFVNTIGTVAKCFLEEMNTKDILNCFSLNTIANINLTKEIIPFLCEDFSQILVCLSSLVFDADKIGYSLQGSSKIAYKHFLEALRNEKPYIRIMSINPDTVQTDVFKKSGKKKDMSKYPLPKIITQIMEFLLSQPKEIEIPEVAIKNRHTL